MEYASNIIFKACVNRNDGTSFKQYVALNKRGECTYECLRVKLMNEFPCLSRKPFSIKWMDYESDMITITNDSDLFIAIGSIKNDVKKLYIKLDEDNVEIPIGNLEINNTNDERHCHVTCDGCSEPIVGFRFKCLKCSNFDICQRCERNGHHSNHVMMRFKRPIRPDQRTRFVECFRIAQVTFDSIDF